MGPGAVFDDTTADAQRAAVQRLRAMSAAERFEQVVLLNAAVEQMATVGVRTRHPDATPEEVRLRVFALRLGRDVMVAVYGWDPDVEGW